jgi:hypothetical protein
MPILAPNDYPPELRGHLALRGVFYGGCVSRGDGSRFRAKAHSHGPKDKYSGWICFLSGKRLKDRLLVLHELAHIITGEGHTDKWRAVLVSIGGTWDEVPGLLKSYERRTKRHAANPLR